MAGVNAALNPMEASETTLSLAMLIIGTATAAKGAQTVMSSGLEPMGIETFQFLFNIACTVKETTSQDVSLTLPSFAGFGGQAALKHSYSSESSLGLKIGCTLKQQKLIDKEARDGKVIETSMLGGSNSGGGLGQGGGEEGQQDS